MCLEEKVMIVKEKREKMLPIQELILESLPSPKRDAISAMELARTIRIPLEHLEHHLIVLAQKGKLLIGNDNNTIWVRKKK